MVDQSACVSRPDADSSPFAAARWLERLTADKSVFVKIDVEGYELAVIAGLLRSAFASSIRMMIFEIDDANLSSFGHRSENVYSLLQEEGFKPRYGARSSAHYDKVFTRSGG